MGYRFATIDLPASVQQAQDGNLYV